MIYIKYTTKSGYWSIWETTDDYACERPVVDSENYDFSKQQEWENSKWQPDDDTFDEGILKYKIEFILKSDLMVYML